VDEALRGDGLGEGEETGVGAALFAKAFKDQGILVVEHGLEPLASDVALAFAINGVAHLHVVGGDRLGNSAGRAADSEEPAGHLLSRADFGEGAVGGFVEIDTERLLVRADALVRGADAFWFHGTPIMSRAGGAD